VGLTIHFQFAHPGPLRPGQAEALVHTARGRAVRLAARRGLAAVGPVLDVRTAEVFADAFVMEPGEEVRLCHDVPPECGWVFQVQPGPGCETATFGLCHYPVRFRAGRRRLDTGCGGWGWSDFCKTQYAGRYGPENFLRCHRAVIDLVLLWQRLGCTVRIKDEGDYWPGRDERRLLDACDLMDRVVAGFAGRLKDAAEEQGARVESPIFPHLQFERLEAEGAEAFGPQIRSAAALVQHLGHML
jgi:hypothetical protein